MLIWTYIYMDAVEHWALGYLFFLPRIFPPPTTHDRRRVEWQEKGGAWEAGKNREEGMGLGLDPRTNTPNNIPGDAQAAESCPSWIQGCYR
jgi:hypothetical protein